MKQEEFMESIYGCLERIENKINGLSMPQSAGGDAEADSSASEVTLQEVIQELNALKTSFKRVLEALVMIKGDTSNLLKRNSMPDKFMETLSVLKSEQQANHKNQNEFLERFAQTEKDTILHISEKMESLSTSVRNQDGGTRCCLSQTQYQHRYTLYILDPDHTGNVLDSCICGFLFREAA